VKTGPEMALAASARDWPDRLHRFLLDHGGGRVRSRVMSPDQAVADEYDILLVDDVCSFLTPRLVRSLREKGREIVGVYNPADAPDAKRRLLECGITDVIESDATADEFLAVAGTTLAHRRSTSTSVAEAAASFRVGVFGPLGGVGVTEVAIGLAGAVSRSRKSLLIDLDQRNPSVAQRLDLPLHPNLLTAADMAHHSGDVDKALVEHDGMSIVGGLAAPGHHELRLIEVGGLLDEIGRSGFEVVVADLGSAAPDQLDYLRFNVLIAVGLASPVGVSRLVRTVSAVITTVSSDTVAVVNRVSPGVRNVEMRSELERLLPDVPIVLLPEDRRLERAAWDGLRLTRGPFARSVGRIAGLIEGATR